MNAPRPSWRKPAGMLLLLLLIAIWGFAVVTVADNGGSSGRLRGEFGVLPPGDLRMALAALCGDDEWGRTWAEVLQHRFAGEGEMQGHVTGNLLIVSLWELMGDHVRALVRGDAAHAAQSVDAMRRRSGAVKKRGDEFKL